MDTPNNRNPPRPDQPTLFAMPADGDVPPRPAAPPPPPGRPRLRTANRQQIVFRTAALDDLIPPDHPARIVWEFVEGLDLSPLYDSIKAVAGTAGRPAIDPKILMALWLYATIDGVGMPANSTGCAATTTPIAGSSVMSRSTTTPWPTSAPTGSNCWTGC